MSYIRFLPVVVFVLFQLDIHQLRTIRVYDSALKTYAFAELNFLACLLFGALVYIRYRQINDLIDQHKDLRDSSFRINKNALKWGIYFCLTWFVAATFQQVKVYVPSDPEWGSVHYLSGLCCFGFAIAYFRLQARLTYNMFPYIGFRRLARVRSILTGLCIMLFSIYTLLGIISQILYYGYPITHDFYSSTNAFYCVSIIFECILAMVCWCYILTFVYDFESITITLDQQMILVEQNKKMEIFATEKV